MVASMRSCRTTMEWNTEIPDIPKGTSRWFVLPGSTNPSSYFFHFSTHFSTYGSGTIISHSPWRKYMLNVPMARKVGFLHKTMNWSSFEFALSNAKFHKRPSFPAELFGIYISRNYTINKNIGDHIEFQMFLPFPMKFHPVTIRGWVEAKIYPGSDLISFRNARIMFV